MSKKNITAANPGRAPRPDTTDGNIDNIDIIARSIVEGQKERDKKHVSKVFRGVVLLYTGPYPEGTIIEATSADFVSSIKLDTESDETFYEYNVFIPEISGCFPRYSQEEYDVVLNQLQSDKYSNAEQKKLSLRRIYLDKKIKRFPRFYISSKSGEITKTLFKLCEVEYPDIRNLSYGKYLKTI